MFGEDLFWVAAAAEPVATVGQRDKKSRCFSLEIREPRSTAATAERKLFSSANVVRRPTRPREREEGRGNTATAAVATCESPPIRNDVGPMWRLGLSPESPLYIPSTPIIFVRAFESSGHLSTAANHVASVGEGERERNRRRAEEVRRYRAAPSAGNLAAAEGNRARELRSRHREKSATGTLLIKPAGSALPPDTMAISGKAKRR
jgi:hypothetical protein